MNKIGYIVLGSLIGYWSHGASLGQYWNQEIQIHGGAFTSSPVADVWGYADDWEGCLTLVAGANLINSKEREMGEDAWRKLINEWSQKGNTSCHRK